MPNEFLLHYFREQGVLPYQAQFAQDFLAPDAPYCWRLVEPVGVGRTRFVKALISYDVEKGGQKRVLLLSPRSLLNQWASELESAIPDCEPLIVDRNTLLELESSVPMGQTPWPRPAIILMSFDLAKRDDMADSLSDAHWDLVIIDESHLLVGKRQALFSRLIQTGAAHRALLLTYIKPEALDDITTRIIDPSDIQDWDGQRIYPSFDKKLLTLSYRRSNEECQLLEEIQQFAKAIYGHTQSMPLLRFTFSYEHTQAMLLLRFASSSIYMVESALRRLSENWSHLRTKLDHDVPLSSQDFDKVDAQLERLSDEPAERPYSGIYLPPAEFPQLCDKLETILDRIDEVPVDSKLEALISHLRQCWDTKKQPYLCVWSTFSNTVHYLSSAIRQAGIPVHSLTGSMKPETLMDNMRKYRDERGVLVTTDAAGEGVTLEYVKECIIYDLPLSPITFEQRWGRFLRLGRKEEFRMVLLRDETRSFLWEENALKLLVDKLGIEVEEL